MAKKKIESYEKAMIELKAIVEQLQEEAIGIDDLSDQVKRATTLIAYCRNKLRSTETELKDFFTEQL